MLGYVDGDRVTLSLTILSMMYHTKDGNDTLKPQKMQVDLHSRKCFKFYYNYSIYSSDNVVAKNTYFGTNTIDDFMFSHKKNKICLFVYMLPPPSELRPKMAAEFAYIG